MVAMVAVAQVAGEFRWHPGFWVGVVLFGGVAAICLLLLLAALVLRAWKGAALLFGVALVSVLLLAGLSFPWEREYHGWTTTGGTVAQIDKRLLPSGEKGMEEKFVVVFAGVPGQYGCLDTRCASVREGDTLWLACKKEWDFAGTDGWDCRFKHWERPDA